MGLLPEEGSGERVVVQYGCFRQSVLYATDGDAHARMRTPHLKHTTHTHHTMLVARCAHASNVGGVLCHVISATRA
jgi:hypothetical protein